MPTMRAALVETPLCMSMMACRVGVSVQTMPGTGSSARGTRSRRCWQTCRGASDSLPRAACTTYVVMHMSCRSVMSYDKPADSGLGLVR